jgi:microcystin-dependent protein
MKKLIVVVCVIIGQTVLGQVGIGTTNPDVSSALDVSSTDSGILVPRMTVAQRIVIATPAEGLLVYQTDDVSGFYFYNGSQWVRLLESHKDAVPTAAIFAFPAITIPSGYLECDGSAISRTTYADLFAVIGTSYGAGDGSTTFNLPDYRGEFLRGFDNGANNDPDAAIRTDRGDGTTGDAIGTRQPFSNATHTHQVDPPSTLSSASGAHTHSIPGTSVTTNSAGNHVHGGTVSGSTNPASNTMQVPYREVEVEVPGVFDPSVTIRELRPGTGSLTIGGSHVHTLNASLNTTNSGTHYHSVNIPTRNSSSSGNHQHTVDISSFDSDTHGGNESRPANVSVMWCIKY